jgi:hypothetical protein
VYLPAALFHTAHTCLSRTRRLFQQLHFRLVFQNYCFEALSNSVSPDWGRCAPFLYAQRLPQHIYYFKWMALVSSSVYIYIYICVCVCVCIYIYIHTYIHTYTHIFMHQTTHIFTSILITRTAGHAVALFVKAPRYKSEGHDFDFGRGHWDFSLTHSFLPLYDLILLDP